MITIIGLNEEGKILENLSYENRRELESTKWYWADFENPTSEEIDILYDYFQFHDLALDDCLNKIIQRPKLDHYDNYHFLIFQSMDMTLNPNEINMFLGKNFLVTFHLKPSTEIEKARNSFLKNDEYHDKNHIFMSYLILDALVTSYFPIVHHLEDQIGELEEKEESRFESNLLNKLFGLRGDLLKVRKSVSPMKDLVYQILSSKSLESRIKEEKMYFMDVHDHLIKQLEIIDSNRELTSDMRENFISLNSHRMNSVMMILTVITTVFMPLTFIVGIYGMNFENMPELKAHYGYYYALVSMGFIAILMSAWFWKKGWFRSV